jgi:hypothetical protein
MVTQVLRSLPGCTVFRIRIVSRASGSVSLLGRRQGCSRPAARLEENQTDPILFEKY